MTDTASATHEWSMMENPASGENSIKFSLVSGGPFHGILARLGLLGPDRLPTWQTVVALVLLAWAPPAALAPFLVVVASQVPLAEVMKWIVGAVL